MNTETPYIVVIGGPTGSGKTDLAVQLAQAIGTEILNADSRQLYKELNIGVAKPTEQQLSAVKHHFVSEFSIHDEMNAGKFATLARERLTDIIQRTGKVIVTGGTGLYIQALLNGIDNLPETPDFIRRHVEKTYLLKGLPAIQAQLMGINPEAALNTEMQNPARVKRALELAMSSAMNDSIYPQNAEPLPYQTFSFYTNPDRHSLYKNINLRVDAMIREGLEQEVKELYSLRHLKALQTVGYTEFFEYFDGSITKEVCIEKLKQHTRNYAKRQITWFKNKFHGIPLPNTDALVVIFEELKKHGRIIYQ